jgi:hypothetical protein
MANNYGFQFPTDQKPHMWDIEGRVMVGTGGLPDATTASGTTYGAGTPSGWQGGYSGMIGLIGAGIASVQRSATGTFKLNLAEGYAKPVNSCQVTILSGVTGYAGASGLLIPFVNYMNVGQGAAGVTSTNPGVICISFVSCSTGLLQDLPPAAGFMVHIRLCDDSGGNLQ